MLTFTVKATEAIRRFIESPRFRNRVRVILLILGFISIGVAVVNPLKSALTGQYYDNLEWKGSPILTVAERAFDLKRMHNQFPFKTTNYSMQWTGALLISPAGEYQFTTVSDDGSELYIDDRLIVDNRGLHGMQERTNRLHLEKGFHSIRIRFMQAGGAAALKIYWTPPGKKRELLSYAPLFSKVPSGTTSFLIYRTRKILLPLLILLWCLILIAVWVGVSANTSQTPQLWHDEVESLLIVMAFLFSSRLGHAWKQKMTREAASDPDRSSWWRVNPLILKLFTFLIISSLAINIVLSLFNYNTTLYFTRFFLTSPVHAGSDSWDHMYRVVHDFESDSDLASYAKRFFEYRIKFIYPPTGLLLNRLAKDVPYNTQVAVANFVSWLMVILTMFMLSAIFSLGMRHYESERKPRFAETIIRVILAICFTVTFYPIVKSFELGQVQTWLYFLFVTATWMWMTGRKGVSGVCIGLICIMKPQLGLLAIWGVLRKEWRFVTGILVTAGIAGIVSLWVFGLQNHLEYLQVLSYISKRGESYYPNQSINGFLNRLFFNGPNLHGDPHFYPPYHLWVHIGTTLGSVLLIGFALFWKRDQHRGAELIDFMIAALSFTMASPLAWEHHHSVMLPIFAVALPATLASRFRKRGLAVLMLSYVLSCNFYPVTNELSTTRFNFIQSYLLFGAVLLLFYLYRLRVSR